MKPVSTNILLSIAAASLSWLLPITSAGQSKADKDFVVKAAQSNLAEIQAGQLAITQGSTEMVRRFGTMMVNDHTTALNELDSIVRKSNTDPLPTEPDAEHKALIEQLQGMTGKAFDDAYLQSQVKDHKTAIALFEAQLSLGESPSLKDYATEALPRLRMHLDHVQTLAAGTK